MARVTGIGGVFIKSRDPEALAAWYRDHLGLPYKKGEGASILWKDDAQVDGGMSVFNTFPQTTKYFEPSTSSFMINFRVDDIDALVEKLKAEGVQVDPKRDDYDFGRFAWVYDPDGNKIELWQPL
jgi:catechol 2,3-dioxygenase-like lactoylglutathione lyase family enzyme